MYILMGLLFSLKMHKSKATTMRMVTFLELGVDCVYTIECSLAGKYPHHFTAQDLLKFGSELGLGLVEVYPSLTTSPISSSLNECSGTNEDSKESKRYVKGQRYGWGDNSFSICSTTLEGISAPEVEAPTGQFANEILKWRVHCDEYNIKSGFGASLLTPAATKELTCAVVEDGDSDDDKEYKDGGGGSDASESVTLGLVQSVSAPTSHKSNKDDALMGTSSKSSTSRRSNSKSSSNSNGTSNASEGMPPNPSRSGSIFKRKALPLSATAALSSGLGSIALDLPSASPSPAGNNIGNSGKEFGSSGSVSGKGGSGFLSSSKFIMSPTSASGGGIAGAGDAIAAGIAGLSLTGRNSSSLNPSGGAQSKGSSSTLRSSSGSTGANGSGTGSINMNLVAGVVRATGSAPSTSRLVSTCSTVKTSSSGMNKAGNGSSPGPWVVSCPLSPPNTDPSVSGNGLLAKQNVAKLSPPRERRTKESKSRSPSPGTEAEAGSSAFFIPNENTPSHSPVRSKSKPPTLSSFSDTSRVSKTPRFVDLIFMCLY